MRIVITGGAYSGKTSIINELSKNGYDVISESAMEIISEINSKLGIECQKKWRAENFVDFLAMIIERQKEHESKINLKKDELIFFDRGIYDSLAFCELMNITIPKRLIDLAKGHEYDVVFILETLSDFDNRKDTGRISDEKRSIKTRDLIEKIYSNYGFKVVSVKEMSIKDRIRFIKTTLNIA